MNRMCFIAGVHAGCGKTYAITQLARRLLTAGQQPAVMKPVQTGMTDPLSGDLGELRRSLPELPDIPPMDACCYCLEPDAPPDQAAAQSGIEIDLRRITAACRNIFETYHPDCLLLEGTGCADHKLNDRFFAADIPVELEIPVFLVTDLEQDPAEKTAQSVRFLQDRGAAVEGILLNRCPEGDFFPADQRTEAMEELCGIPVLARLAPGGGFHRDALLARCFD